MIRRFQITINARCTHCIVVYDREIVPTYRRKILSRYFAHVIIILRGTLLSFLPIIPRIFYNANGREFTNVDTTFQKNRIEYNRTLFFWCNTSHNLIKMQRYSFKSYKTHPLPINRSSMHCNLGQATQSVVASALCAQLHLL